MTYVDIPKGTVNWDIPVNAAFHDQDDRITALESGQGADYYTLVASSDAPDALKARADYVCDGVDDQFTIQEAVDYAFGLNGGIVQLSSGRFNFSSPLTLHPLVTLTGTHGDQIFNPTQMTVQSRIVVQATFVGGAAIVMLGQTAGGYPDKSGEQRIFHLTIDGTDQASPAVHGIQASDYVHGVYLADVAVKNVSGKGIYTFTENGSQPFSWTFHRTLVDNATDVGFHLVNHTDCTMVDCVAIGSGASNYTLSNMPNSRMIGCRAEWSDAHGYKIEGNWGTGAGAGGIQFNGCSTDRNGQNGFDITSTGSAPVVLNGVTTRRDGRNNGTGGGGYAGVFAASATTPILINGWSQYPGVDDNGTGTNSPQVGGSFSGNTVVQIESAYIHAATTPLSNTGTNTTFSLGPNIVQATGSTAAPSRSVPILGTSDWTPQDHGLKSWTFDPSDIQGAAAATAGTVYMAKIPIRTATTITSTIVTVTNAGGTLTAGQNFIGLYDTSGNRLAISADQTTNWGTIGTKTAGFAGGPVVVQPGYVYVAFVSNGTAPPQFARSQNTSASATNVNLTAATGRYITTVTGQTTLPATINMVSTAVTDSSSRWIAIA